MKMAIQSGSQMLSIVLMLLWLTRPGACVKYQDIYGVPAKYGFLAEEEVNALRDIAKELGKNDWNFSANPNPCSRDDRSWRTSDQFRLNYVNEVNCSNCSQGICHVATISLKRQNLAGVLPKSLGSLRYLKYIDLSFNYLTGTIPLEWATMSLRFISVIVNRLSGEIPKQLGNISTLKYISLEDNMFHGTIPAELGKLTNLQKLTLSGNYFNGELPRELTKLSNLDELELGRNNFSGHLPDYFNSWRKLERLEIQASGFMGPIPSTMSMLTELTDLRISDLNGVDSNFPRLQKMSNMTYLILRNCNISGSIPEDIADNMTSLKTLDLSFNKLNGTIPDSLGNLRNLEGIYVTSNFLTGSIPDWIKDSTSMYITI